MTRLLHTLQSSQDLKKFSVENLGILAADIRQVILETLPKTGGHLASNLGVVELTLALYHVYDFPHDRLVLDVGHQCYPHKLLTGRLARFATLRQKGGISGFPSPWESEHDLFITGHAGTAVSTALGLAAANDVLGEKRKIVAVVGDGSICGLTFEGLNHCGELKKNLVVILNDNRMAISPTVGALSRSLNHLRSGEAYRHLVEEIKHTVQKLPVLGEKLEHLGDRVLHLLSANLIPGQFFNDLGFKYYGPVDGHDLPELIAMLHNVREIKAPVLLHVKTQKGKGSPDAERDPLKFYATSRPTARLPHRKPSSWSQCFADALTLAARENPRIIAITAAMAQGTKLEAFMKEFPQRALDTGIAEAHAVTLAGGLERAGLLPVVLIYSTFLQRSYDSIMHDICLQKGGVVVFALDRAGLVGDDGASHHGVFDIAYLRHLPRMILMAPRDGEELAAMLRWALIQNHPVAIRYPRGDVPDLGLPPPAAIESGVPEVLVRGERVALLAYGAMVEAAVRALPLLREHGLRPTLVNLRFAKPLLAEHLAPLLAGHEFIFTLEDHALMGGLGSALLELINSSGLESGRVVRLGIPDAFVTYADRDELLAMLKLDAKGIAATVMENIAVGTTLAPK